MGLRETYFNCKRGQVCFSFLFLFPKVMADLYHSFKFLPCISDSKKSLIEICFDYGHFLASKCSISSKCCCMQATLLCIYRRTCISSCLISSLTFLFFTWVLAYEDDAHYYLKNGLTSMHECISS